MLRWDLTCAIIVIVRCADTARSGIENILEDKFT